MKAANPDTQLADRYAEEALKVAEALNREASELAKSTEFEESLATPRSQLASALEQQRQLAQDVRQVGEDVARAARHERRLNNPSAAEPVEAVAEQIKQVADNEVADARDALEKAVEADEASNGQPQPGQAVQSQQALAESQQALDEQANQLAAALEPLLSAEGEAGTGEGKPLGEGRNADPAAPEAGAADASGQASQGEAQGASQAQSGAALPVEKPGHLLRGVRHRALRQPSLLKDNSWREPWMSLTACRRRHATLRQVPQAKPLAIGSI